MEPDPSFWPGQTEPRSYFWYLAHDSDDRISEEDLRSMWALKERPSHFAQDVWLWLFLCETAESQGEREREKEQELLFLRSSLFLRASLISLL